MLFLYNCDVRKTVKREKILSENFIKRWDTMLTIVNMKGRICVFRNNYINITINCMFFQKRNASCFANTITCIMHITKC